MVKMKSENNKTNYAITKFNMINLLTYSLFLFLYQLMLI